MTEANEPNQTDFISVGEQLRQGRERKGLSIEQVVAKLNLTSQVVKALEQDDEAHLPDKVFIRGYIRSYAKLLGLDADSLLANVQLAGVRETKSIKAVQEMKEPRRSSRGTILFFAVVCLVVLVVLGYYWWQEQQNKPSAPQNVLESVEVDTNDGSTQIHVLDEPIAPKIVEIAAAADSAPLAINQARSLELDAAVQTQNQQPAAASTAVANTPVNPLPAAEAPQAAPVVQAEVSNPAPVAVAQGKVALTIKFTSQCWFEIKDANDKPLLTSVKNAGDVVNVQGIAPLSVHLGNAKGQSVLVNNVPFDISSYIKGTTARFKVGQ